MILRRMGNGSYMQVATISVVATDTLPQAMIGADLPAESDRKSPLRHNL